MQEPAECYIDKDILKPLGMTHTFFNRTPSFLLKDRSHSYRLSAKGIQEARFNFNSGINSLHCGLNAPLHDMAKFMGLLQGSQEKDQQARYESILKRTSLEEMWQGVSPVSSHTQIGLGFFLERHGSRDFIMHNGNQNGFISEFYLDRASGKALLTAYNTEDSRKSGLMAWMGPLFQAALESAF